MDELSNRRIKRHSLPQIAVVKEGRRCLESPGVRSEADREVSPNRPRRIRFSRRVKGKRSKIEVRRRKATEDKRAKRPGQLTKKPRPLEPIGLPDTSDGRQAASQPPARLEGSEHQTHRSL